MMGERPEHGRSPVEVSYVLEDKRARARETTWKKLCSGKEHGIFEKQQDDYGLKVWEQ